MNKVFLFLTLASASFTHLICQDYSTIQKALDAERNYNYCKAIKYYKRAAENDSKNEYLHYKIGKNYFNQNNYESSIYHMEKASRIMKDSMNYHFDMYHLYSVTGYTALAKESFIRYINLCPSCVKSNLLPGGQSNKFIYSRPIKEPTLMGYESKFSESYPYILDDDKIQTLNNRISCKSISNPLNFKGNLTYNYSCHDFMFFDVKQNRQKDRAGGHRYGPFALSKDKEQLYVTRFDNHKNRLFIYYSKRGEGEEDNSFTEFKAMEIEIDKGGFDYIHPMLTEDNKHLIFSSNQPGGLGGYDLWIGEIQDNYKLTKVKSLGTYVNTPGDECFPTIYDDKVIFFASNGHYGLGKLDMYVGVRGKAAKFNRTYNLGANFNSEDDDYAFFYHKAKNSAFFTSNRFINHFENPTDRIYKQSFDKIKTTITVKDELKRPVSGMKVSIPSEKLEMVTNQHGQIVASVNPIGYKKVVITGENNKIIDTNLYPFENRLDLVTSRNLPKDIVTFALLSHPFENAYPSKYYKITNIADCNHYSGYTDEAGIGQVVLYLNEDYRVEVPELRYVSPVMKFSSGKNKIFVTSDLPPEKEKPEVKEKPAPALIEKLVDNFNIYYETTKWNITEQVDRQIQYVIRELSKHPNYKLELRAHTDCQGDSKTNLVLSRQRLAEAVKLFFSRGVNESQIQGYYFGEDRPINRCRCDEGNNYNCSNEDLKQNRRTEVRLIR